MMDQKTAKVEPLVGVVIGSDTDLPALVSGLELLEEWGVPFEVKILSAHRTPKEAAEFAQTAADRGLKVIIAAAGMAAHLPGVLAAHTHLPVIGVPIASGELRGPDALYSIVQMPPGIPVACVGINAGRNAAILAMQILGLTDPVWQDKLDMYRKKQAEAVLAKSAKLEELGFRAYLSGKQP